MEHELQALEKGSIHREGRRRLRVLLCGLSGAGCAVAMATVLVVYGTPFNPMWWWVMGAILVAAFVLPAALVPCIEWVVVGYLGGRGRS